MPFNEAPGATQKTWLDTQRPERAAVVTRNVLSMKEMRDVQESRKGREDRIADAITRFTGSMPFVYVHAIGIALWLLLNSGWVHWVKPWDPYPFVLLPMAASLEAIFLSTFVLISQNRKAEIDERRDELDLQISLLTEHEVTRLISMSDALMKHFKLQASSLGLTDLEELKKDVPPEEVLTEIEKVQHKDVNKDS